MPDVISPDWLSWAFWAQHHEIIRDLVITLAALVGIPFVVWREWLHHRQTKAALQQAEVARQQAATAQLRHEEQVKADRERRITDNFMRAVEQLGSDKLETRLGAIYTLERIARESQIDHWPIMETLTAYVRERAPWSQPQVTEEDQGEEPWDPRGPATDVQAILTVIGRRRREYEEPDQILNLSGTDLRNCQLQGAHLERADFLGTHLEGADLRKAHLQAAKLQFTHLKEASLIGAHLNKADFFETYLEGAWLVMSDITREQCDYAYIDERTHLPDHIKGPAKPARDAAEAQNEVAATPRE